MTHYDSNQFKTFDLALAAALVAQGFPIESLERATYKAAFCFVRDNKLDVAVNHYWADRLLVNPRIYFDQLKHIKTRIYAE